MSRRDVREEKRACTPICDVLDTVSEKKRFLKKEKIKVEIGAELSFCGVEIGEEDLFAVTDETCLMGRKEGMEKKIQKVAELALQCSVGLQRLMALTVLCCGVS